MAKKGLGLPETKGFYQTKGIVTGTKKDGFYKELVTKSKMPMRMVNFALKTSEKSNVYLSMSGMERDFVYFSKTEKVDGKKVTDTIKVPWKDRFDFKKEGYRMFGVNVGVKKVLDKDNKEVNDKKTLVEYDACKEVSDNLVDGVSVFSKGKLDFSSYVKDGNTKRATKLVPAQLSLCQNVDFEKEGFEASADFKQTFIFDSIEKVDGKEKWLVNTKIITYNSVEQAEFIIYDKALASDFRKQLKPYTAIEVCGVISSLVNDEKVEKSKDDVWGNENQMSKLNAPIVIEFVITAAYPSSIDTTTYTETAVNQVIQEINANKKASGEFGKKEGGWSAVADNNASEEDSSVDW